MADLSHSVIVTSGAVVPIQDRLVGSRRANRELASDRTRPRRFVLEVRVRHAVEAARGSCGSEAKLGLAFNPRLNDNVGMPDGAGWPVEADYAWVEGWRAFCVSFVEGTKPQAVLDRMVDDPAAAIMSVAEAREWASEQTEPGCGSVIEARMVGGWAVTVETTSCQATLPEVVRRMSKGSRAVVVFRDMHAYTSFVYAVDGVVIRSFDPFLYGNPTPWDGPPLPEESGLDFGGAHPMSAAFACAERITGTRLTRDLRFNNSGWVAITHHPTHSLSCSGSWPQGRPDAKRYTCEEDPELQIIPSRLLSREDLDDGSGLLPLDRWSPWVSSLVVIVVAAAGVAMNVGMWTGHSVLKTLGFVIFYPFYVAHKFSERSRRISW